MMYKVGLTGGIGSGKSTVATLFAKLGVTVIDADIIAREVVKPGLPAYQQIVRHFGPSILQQDKQIDRKQYREIIFNDSAEKQWLENLLHPIILKTMQQQTEKATSPYCVMVIPLLIESHSEHRVDRILTVDVATETQLKRTQQRDNTSQQLTAKIHKQQAARETRLEHADDVIENNGTLEDLEIAVKKLHRHYLELARSKTSS